MKKDILETGNARRQDGQVNNNEAQQIVSDALAQPTAEEMAARERLKFLEQYRLTTLSDVPPERPALSVDGVGIFARGDIHAVKAKQKQGKTSVLKVCGAALMAGGVFRLKSELGEPTVLYIDTEQKLSDAKLVATDIRDLSARSDDYINRHLHLYALRTLTYEHMMGDISLLITTLRPQVVFIDGIVDVVESFNDEVCSKNTIETLMRISQEQDCAIVCVLHTNKAKEDDNMRGHLGTMLAQKAGTVLECRKQERIITVECPDSRHAPMPSWSVCFDEEGRIVDADEQRKAYLEQRETDRELQRQKRQQEAVQRRTEAALQILGSHGNQMSRKDFIEAMMKRLSLGKSTIYDTIRQLETAKTIRQAEDGMIQVYGEQLGFF